MGQDLDAPGQFSGPCPGGHSAAARRYSAGPSLSIGTGMSGHGFGIGPGMGRVLADLVAGQPVGHDLTRFRLDRFRDGSPMRLGPAL